MKKITNQLSREAVAVKVQLQEFNQNRRMIRNLLAEKKMLMDMCDMLKSSGSIMSDGGETFSKQEQLLFRLENINAKISDLLTKTANTESILLSAMDTLTPTEYNMLWERYAVGKNIAQLCKEFYYSDRWLHKRYNQLFNKLIPYVLKEEKFNEEIKSLELEAK